ncbi:MAG: hydroxyectoine utilization dehydratase EutB [Alphaproteobacteria bacterium]
MTEKTFDPKEIEAAHRRIAPHVLRTPLVPCYPLSDRTGGEMRLKLELLQPTGAFKLRGATNAILSLTDEERSRGVVTCSTGNHGRGVACAAQRVGARAVICMSKLVPQTKIDGVKRFGAEVRIIGDSQDEAEVEALRLTREEGLVYLSPFDHRDVIAGQGTIGLELLEDWPEVDTVIVPLSGGGLLGGIAAAVKAGKPSVRLIGVTMDRGPAMVESLAAGGPVEVVEEPTLADSLGGGIGLQNEYTFALIRDLVDETVLVSEAEIAEAMRYLYREQQIVAEGGASVGVAALLAGKIDCKGRKTALIISGRNVDMDVFNRIAAGENVDLKAEKA